MDCHGRTNRRTDRRSDGGMTMRYRCFVGCCRCPNASSCNIFRRPSVRSSTRAVLDWGEWRRVGSGWPLRNMNRAFRSILCLRTHPVRHDCLSIFITSIAKCAPDVGRDHTISGGLLCYYKCRPGSRCTVFATQVARPAHDALADVTMRPATRLIENNSMRECVARPAAGDILTGRGCTGQEEGRGISCFVRWNVVGVIF